MLKLFTFAIGIAAGAAGATAWLLSDGQQTGGPAGGPSLGGRVDELRVRFQAALAEGERDRQETENRLRHELDAYRAHPSRPGTS